MSDLITLPRATVQQALEALDRNWDGCVNSPEGEAITALKAALAQPGQQQEPVKRVQHAPKEPRRSNPPAVYKDEGIEAWYYAKPR